MKTRIIGMIVGAVVAFPFVHAAEPGTLSIEQRVASQKAIERVFWSHRIWPKANPGAKPTLSEVMPDAAIRAKVEDDLRKAAALETLWGRSISSEELQSELVRIASETRDAGMLRELFGALHDDPQLVTECLVRPILVDRVLRTLYDQDDRFGGLDRRRARDLYATLGSLSSLRGLGGRYEERTWRHVAGEDRSGGGALDDAQWAQLVHGLGERLGLANAPRDAASLPSGRISPLQETESTFDVLAVASATADTIRVVSVSWPRETFDAWWGRNSISYPAEAPAVTGTSRALPPIPAAGACTDDTWTPTKQDVADPRQDHVAVWTGSEMLIWGGRTGSNAFYELATGWRYSPATDSWTKMAPAPIAGRHYLVGVWSGTEMIVWGGQNAAQAFDDGARYNPISNTWQSTSTAGAASPRGYATAVWTGTQMIVWGGSTSTFLNTGARYTPGTNSWAATTTVNAPAGRYLHTAVWSGTEMIVWGGYPLTNTGGRYNPVSDTWTATSLTGAPGGRYGHVAVWTGSAMIVHGGTVINSPTAGGRYDPSTDTWQPIAQWTNGQAAVWTGQLMLLWNGSNPNQTARYDPVANAWGTVSAVNVPSPRSFATAVWTGTEMIVWGGQGPTNTGSRYNPVSDTWTATGIGTVPLPRESATSVWTGAEVVLWGGTSGAGATGTGSRYSPALDTWTPTSLTGAPSARFYHVAIWTGTRMVIWGGNQDNTGGQYDPGANSWTSTSITNAPTVRNGESVVWTGTRMIVWGGNFGNYQNTGGQYDPVANTWTPTATFAAPAARYEHVGVWTGSKMIVWGGYPHGNPGGIYDPAADSWISISSTGQPQVTDNAAAVWTGSEMLVWGGAWNINPYPNAVGRYNPSTDTWTSGSSMGAPPGRESPSYAWTGIELIVWGGNVFDGGNRRALDTGGRYNPSSDTWRLTTQQGAPTPLANFFAPNAPWTGSELFLWGGYPYAADGGRYCACANPATVYRDVDGDGFGDVTKPATGCAGLPPAGYALNHDDCNDADGTIYPGAPQLCDGKNNNCSDPSWPAVPANEANADGDAFRICAGDCNDGDATIYPGATQLCDGKNNNCSDPSWPTVPANEADADGDGFRICANDCNDANPAIRPNAVDVCNGIDDNCNGLIDDDALGVDTDGDGVHNACDNCRTVANPTQTDTDGDHVGNVCDNCPSLPNTAQADADGDAIGDACDNCPNASNPSQLDTDADKIGDNCDDCLFDYNPTQSDFDHDGEGDICDVNDGLIYIFGTDDKTYVEWQQETGPTAFNVYTGDLSVLRSAGTYTQAPGSNPLASRTCQVADPFSLDPIVPGAGQVEFSLVTGVAGGVEGSLGTNSAGTPRPNVNPCP